MVQLPENLVGGFIAAVNGTGDAVVHARCGTIHAADGGIAEFAAIAEQTIIAGLVIDQMRDSISFFIAGVDGAGDLIINLRCVTSDTALACHTEFTTVTEQAIIASLCDGRVDDAVRDFIASVLSTFDLVIDDRWLTRLAIIDRVTAFLSVTEKAIIA